MVGFHVGKNASMYNCVGAPPCGYGYLQKTKSGWFMLVHIMGATFKIVFHRKTNHSAQSKDASIGYRVCK